jgi:hypothetical protein
VENCYRWAGETDVFEAIESACRNYKIDRNRIVLRGMSMGASGTWHLGLKYPGNFVALGPYAGYVDTHRFSAMPFPNFIKVGSLPPVQEQSLHMLDSIDYAANAGVVPVIAAMGEKDMGFDNHVFMGEAMAREGLQLVNLVSAGTGHVVDPVTHREQMRRIAEIAGKGVDRGLPDLRFVTWTLKYNRCHWIELLGLKTHYQRAEITAHLSADGSVNIDEPINITQFAIHPPALEKENSKLRIGAAQITLPARKKEDPGSGIVLSQKDGLWKFAGTRDSFVSAGKRPGLQGPIDDAFTAPFLCVRGTGRPWNAQIASWADANLRRFAHEWARYLRGDLPIKNDTEVTLEDLRTKNLILFGDPGNNSWIRKALPNLPVTWTREEVAIGRKSGPAKDHAPALICANPLSGANGHYVVLNSGHTFHEKELSSFNYLLFPRLGDWALIHVWPGAENWRPDTSMFPEDIVQAGFFNERWHSPNSDSSSTD